MSALYTTSQVAALVREAIESAAATVARLSAENEVLHRENAQLRRDAGKARLLTDLRLQAFELSADSVPMDEPRAFFRRQV